MKKGFLAIFGLFSLLMGCKKSGGDDSGGTTTLSAYMSVTANSSWQYEQIANPSGGSPTTTNYTVTSTNRDSTISGKQYHVYTNSSTGGSEYYNITGSDYYQYRDLPAAVGVGKIEALYLKDNVAINGTWNQNITVTVSSVPITLTLTYTVIEKNTTKIVNGITYNEVIGVKTVITPATPGIPASAITGDIKSYYARKVGLIQNDTYITVNIPGIINQTTDNQIKLKTSDIR